MKEAVNNTEQTLFFGDPIHQYTRADAIADGFLVDVTEVAKEAGFVCPVAVTNAVWEDCIEWSEDDSKRQTHQDLSGRLWDVLWMAFITCQDARGKDHALYYSLYRVPRGGRKTKPRKTTLKILTGPGDNGEQVITILQPNED